MSLRPLLVVFLIFCCNSCAVSPPSAPGVAASGVAFLALGDSYTIGEGEAEAARWPVQLAALARQQGLALQEPNIIARTGWTTAELQAAIADARPAPTYGLVSLLIGVNNQYRGQGVARYRPEFRALLHQAIGFAGGRPGRVVVLSIPDWGQSPFGQQRGGDPAAIGAEIDQFNAVAQDECRQAGVAYVDITALTRAATPDRSQFTRDGLHYSQAHMRQWAEWVLPVVQARLQ
ncbi:SGNH/GDSL hydrolase family protein [Hymenobacter sp. BT442]|uniref:SGNH/GDSL hydrolase family protein n=2 Tax=Hymenobacter negativus TaxID=2795026 RepID=A0ABS0Q675_9BACT|nr:SGNH/GDSL hydrolase family protein [Hymenobacter negativus]MBH8568647.1 SGNH/GDSL hydrolase family protein [Hymenobacter negativus]